MRILSAEAMQKVDREAIEGFGIPGMVLMENAALGVVEALTEEYPATESVAIYCGPGNNGGDGLAVGRHLAVRGYSVTIVLLAGRQGLAGDAASQLEICRGMGLDIRDIEADDSVAGMLDIAESSDLIVDSLFGTGLARPLDGRFADLVSGLNEVSRPRLAVDLPSGLSGSKSEVFGPTIDADVTVAFAAPKLAHVFPPAAAMVGRVIVADLGIPPELLERADGDLHLLTDEGLSPLLSVRSVESHKGDFGHILVVAGSEGKAGAAVLSARGALRSGAGLVTVATPAPLAATVDGASLESMTVALPLAPVGLGDEAVERLLEAAQDKNFLAVGPGLGTLGDTAAAVRQMVTAAGQPLILDADGLNAFAGRIEDLRGRRAETVLTPHPGELSRLLGVPTDEIVSDRLKHVRQACEKSGAIVVLKGHLTLIADPMGGVYVNPTGNAGLATGGTGDVLTGMIAGFGGQGYGALAATKLAVFLHGRAGDLAAATKGEAGLVAGDVVDLLPQAIQELAAV